MPFTVEKIKALEINTTPIRQSALWEAFVGVVHSGLKWPDARRFTIENESVTASTFAYYAREYVRQHEMPYRITCRKDKLVTITPTRDGKMPPVKHYNRTRKSPTPAGR